MCGIVGYSGQPDQVLPTLLSGLRRLEYRGYDSAGIAVSQQDTVQVVKSVGKIVDLEAKLPKSFGNESTGQGIAHTRWATHGGATEVNAHPHADAAGKIWVVHNGIIENYAALRKQLELAGIEFVSQTDTEVVARLIGYLYHGNLREAVLTATRQLVGAYALAVISQDEPGRLLGVKYASPLVLGVADDELILASDAAAIIDRTKRVIYLEDSELVDIKGANFEVLSFDESPRHKQITELDWDQEQASKQGYAHYLLKEIHEQPQAIIDATRGRIDTKSSLVKFGGLIDVADKLDAIQYVALLGVGTSYYAALLGELYFEALANVHAKAILSPEFRYRDTVINQTTWAIALSQSGETADTLAAVTEAKRRGALVTGIVNTVGSSIARATDAGVYNHIGPEISVASTKAFTSQAVILLMHAVLLGRRRGMDATTASEVLAAIQQVPANIQAVLDGSDQIQAIAQKYQSCHDMLFIGRNLQYPVALEAALKLKEIAYIHTEGLSAGELKHGFIALVENTVPTVALVPPGVLRDKVLANIEELKAREGKIIAVATESIEGANDTIRVPETGSKYTQPIVDVVALQLLAYYIADALERDVDQPRNLAKSVTVE